MVFNEVRSFIHTLPSFFPKVRGCAIPLGCRFGRIVLQGPPPCPGRQVGVSQRLTLDASKRGRAKLQLTGIYAKRFNFAKHLFLPSSPPVRWGGGPCEARWRGSSAPSTAYGGPPPLQPRDLCVTPRLSLLMRQARLNGRVLCRWGEIHCGFEGLLVVDRAV